MTSGITEGAMAGNQPRPAILPQPGWVWLHQMYLGDDAAEPEMTWLMRPEAGHQGGIVGMIRDAVFQAISVLASVDQETPVDVPCDKVAMEIDMSILDTPVRGLMDFPLCALQFCAVAAYSVEIAPNRPIFRLPKRPPHIVRDALAVIDLCNRCVSGSTSEDGRTVATESAVLLGYQLAEMHSRFSQRHVELGRNRSNVWPLNKQRKAQKAKKAALAASIYRDVCSERGLEELVKDRRKELARRLSGALCEEITLQNTNYYLPAKQAKKIETEVQQEKLSINSSNIVRH